MSIIIEQAEKEFRAASEFSTHAELDRVTLVDAAVEKASNIGSLSRPLELSFDYEPGVAAVKSGCANLQVRFNFRAADAAHNDVVTVKCTLEASYSLAKDYSPETDVVHAFHSANAVFNSWPFFREYVQSTVLRMNMPAPPVPLLRLVARPKDESALAPAEKEVRSSSPRRKRQAKSTRG
jgi:uncharacterized membrane protein